MDKNLFPNLPISSAPTSSSSDDDVETAPASSGFCSNILSGLCELLTDAATSVACLTAAVIHTTRDTFESVVYYVSGGWYGQTSKAEAAEGA